MKKTFKEISKLACEYCNILIIHHITFYYDRWGFVNRKEEHFELCKKDGREMPWKRAENRLYTYYKLIGNAKKGIDQFLNDTLVLYTDAQRKKYISNYNYKHSWGFTKTMLITTMQMHKKGDKVMKLLMEDRLEDANFHSYCGALKEEDYDRYMEILNNEYVN